MHFPSPQVDVYCICFCIPNLSESTYIILPAPMGKGSKKSSADSDVDEIEVEPGVGGYSVAIYKKDKLKGAAPLNEDSYSYLKSKYKKHADAPTSKKLLASHKSISKDQKKIKSSSSSSQQPVKEKKPLTETQKENLRKGREARSKKLAEQKALREAEAASHPMA